LIILTATTTAEEAVAWACRRFPTKNTLTSADAEIIEQGFRTRMQCVEQKDNLSNGKAGHWSID
jgi:hypothetical protein